MLPRRRPFELPFADDIPDLAAVILGQSCTPGQPERFGEAAVHHNVVPFVLAAVQEGHLALPETQRRRLADGNLTRVARTALLRREASLVVPLLERACAKPPVALKGPTLGDRYYPSWRQRPYADLDLMLPSEALGIAVAALERSGFTTVEELRPGYAERFGHDVHVRRTVGTTGTVSVDIELHWRMGDDRVGIPLDHAHLLRTAELLQLDDGPVLAPSVPDQLLLASIHLLSDRGKRLSWVNDIRLVAEAANDSEWQRAFETARGCGGGLLWVLHRALDYAGRHLGLARPRPLPAGSPPVFGPLRAVEELDLKASPHIGRLVALRGTERLRYLQAVAVPTRAGLEGTVGGDGAGLPTLVARHAGRALRGVTRRRD